MISSRSNAMGYHLLGCVAGSATRTNQSPRISDYLYGNIGIAVLQELVSKWSFFNTLLTYQACIGKLCYSLVQSASRIALLDRSNWSGC